MIKLDIINEVVNKTGITKTKAEMAVETVFEKMKRALEQGDAFEVEKAEALMVGYHARWADVVVEVLAVEVEFIVTPDESRRLLELIEEEKIRVFYASIPASFGILNPDKRDADAKNL